MIGLLQRTTRAKVSVAGEVIGEIGLGLMVLVGVELADAESEALRLLERLLNYRVFADSRGRMNRSVKDVEGGLLLVPQFTLVADTTRGNRPGFSGKGADPEAGERLFSFLVDRAREAHPTVACGLFGADMDVELVNQGPVTFSLRVPPST